VFFDLLDVFGRRQLLGHNAAFGKQGRSRPFPPKAVFGPSFTPGSGMLAMFFFYPFVLSRPFTGILPAAFQEARERA
jgi:hypothetical protein